MKTTPLFRPTSLVCKALAVCLTVCGSLSSTGDGLDFYVDCAHGNDSQNDGRSQVTAWATIGRANQQAYGPSDRILLKSGCTFTEGFVANGNGTPEKPIVLTSYDALGIPAKVPPIVDAGNGPHASAVLLQNVQHWVVSDLELTHHGQTPQNLDPNNEKGKDADQYSDTYMRAVVHVLGLGTPNDPNCGEGCTVRGIVLSNLLVRDGSWDGIYVSGGYYQLDSAQYGFAEDVTIDHVESRNNNKAGVEITCTYYKKPIYATKRVVVQDSYSHHNGGDGIMVGPVYDGLIQGNECSFNGQKRNARLGCWTWDSEKTVIQYNESHHNMSPLNTGKARDGGGFDLDLGTENGIIQYNYSHDNEGEGFLLDSWPVGFGYDRGVSHNVQVRYNVGEYDGKKLSGGITVFGGVSGLIYNNTIYYQANRLAGSVMFQGEGGALTTSVWGKSGKPDLRIYNNIFIADGRANTKAVSNNLWTDGVGVFAFDNNLWYRVEGGLRFQWGKSVLTSAKAWQAKAFDPKGVFNNPNVSRVLSADPSGADSLAYKLILPSPAIDAGRPVLDPWGATVKLDPLNTPLPQRGAYDIGAFEYYFALPPKTVTR